MASFEEKIAEVENEVVNSMPSFEDIAQVAKEVVNTLPSGVADGTHGVESKNKVIDVNPEDVKNSYFMSLIDTLKVFFWIFTFT